MQGKISGVRVKRIRSTFKLAVQETAPRKQARDSRDLLKRCRLEEAAKSVTNTTEFVEGADL